MFPPPILRRPLAALAALRTLALGLALGLVWLVAPAWSDTVAQDGRQLRAALAGAAPGDTIRLAPGRYGALRLRGVGGDDGRPVTLTSADPADPARLSELIVQDAAHVVLEGLVFDYRFAPGDKIHFRPFQVLDSRDVTIRGALFDGDVADGVSRSADGFGYAFGLGIRGGRGIRVENNEIRNFFRGLVVSDSRDVTVRGNDIHSLRMDGMNFAQVEDVLIEGNRIRDFRRSPRSKDHADMIQFWTNRTERPTRNVVIRGNVLNSGDGLFTQSIFMRNDLVDRGMAGREMFYRDIRIEGNVVVNAHLHGIAVGETEGLVVKDNTVIRNARSEGERDNPKLYDPRISVSPRSRDVQITGNVASRIAGFERQSDWEAHDNFLVQDRNPGRPGYYGRVFQNALDGDPGDLGSFRARPGGPLDGTGFGAPLLRRQ